MLYRYEAVDSAGKLLRGVLDASDEQDLVQKLRARGYTVQVVYGGTTGVQSSTGVALGGGGVSMPRTAATGVPGGGGLPVSVKSRIHVHRLAMFYRQLATMVRSGMPLSQSFGDLMVSTRDGRLRQAIPLLHSDLVSGRSLSGALARFPDLFPAHTVGSTWCGELGGTLDGTLDDIASDIEREAADTRLGRIGWGLTKLSVFCTVLVFPLFNIGRIVEPLAGAAQSAVGSDPAGYIGAFVAGVTHDIARYSLLPALSLLGLWVVWGHIKRVPVVRGALDTMLLRVPVWGQLHLFRSLARFADAMNELYAAGVSPQTAWDAASTTPRNSEVARRLRSARSRSAASIGPGELAAAAGLLEPEDVALINTGQRTGQVPEALAKVAEAYQHRAETLQPVGRMWSLSLLVSTQLAILGAGAIMMVSSYAEGLRMLGL